MRWICSKGRLIGLIPVQRKDLMLASWRVRFLYDDFQIDRW